MKGVGGEEDGGVGGGDEVGGGEVGGEEILNKRVNNPPTLAITNTRGVAYAAEPRP